MHTSTVFGHQAITAYKTVHLRHFPTLPLRYSFHARTKPGLPDAGIGPGCGDLHRAQQPSPKQGSLCPATGSPTVQSSTCRCLVADRDQTLAAQPPPARPSISQACFSMPPTRRAIIAFSILSPFPFPFTFTSPSEPHAPHAMIGS